MHRSLPSLGTLLLVVALSSTAAAQAPSRVSQQQSQEVGPPMPVELMGAPRATPTTPATATTDAVVPTTAEDGESPRTSASMGPVASAAKEIRMSARAGTLVSPRTRAVIPAGASQAVVSLMSWPTAEAERQVRYAFSLSGQSPSAVDGVVGQLANLLSDPDPNQARDAQKHLEEFMKDSPSWFRENPPSEALAVEAALTRILTAAGSVRTADRRREEKPVRTERRIVAQRQPAPAPARVVEPEPVAQPVAAAPAPVVPAPVIEPPAPTVEPPAPKVEPPAPTKAPAATEKPKPVKNDSTATQKKSFWRKLITPAPERTP